MPIDRAEAIKRYLNAKAEHDEAKANLDCQRRRLLEVSGWKETSKTPGSYWLWEKTLDDGRTLLVTEKMALDCEENEQDFVDAADDREVDAECP